MINKLNEEKNLQLNEINILINDKINLLKNIDLLNSQNTLMQREIQNSYENQKKMEQTITKYKRKNSKMKESNEKLNYMVYGRFGKK